MPISNPGQSTLASVEPARVNDRRRGTHTINSIAWSTGGSPGVVFSRWMALFFWLARSMSSRLWLAVRIWRQIPPSGDSIPPSRAFRHTYH